VWWELRTKPSADLRGDATGHVTSGSLGGKEKGNRKVDGRGRPGHSLQSGGKWKKTRCDSPQRGTSLLAEVDSKSWPVDARGVGGAALYQKKKDRTLLVFNARPSNLTGKNEG